MATNRSATNDYPYLRAWNKWINHDDYWRLHTLRLAREDKAPHTAIYYNPCSDGTRKWRTVDRIVDQKAREIVEQIAKEFM